MKFVAVLTILVSAAPQSLLLKGKSGGPMFWAWGNRNDWVLLDTRSGRSEHMSSFSGHIAKDIAVSNDGKRFVFQDDATDQLFAWMRDAPPRLLDPSRGFFADPAFSEDAETVYYAHSDSGGIGAHGERDWAQIWSVPWAGGVPTKLTATPGCHSNPSIRGMNIYFVHANCHGDFGISVARLPGLDDREIVPRERQVDGVFERDGRLFYTDSWAKIVTVRSVQTDGGSAKDIFKLPENSDPPRMFVTFDNAIIFQSRGKVMIRDSKTDKTAVIETYAWRGIP